jgi:prevent-host-death family protein
VPKNKTFGYTFPEPKHVSIRDVSHNLAHYVEYAKTQPVVINKYKEPQAVLVSPEYLESLQKQATKPKKKMRLEDLPFFTEFVKPEDWKGKTSLQIAQELRERASGRSYDE